MAKLSGVPWRALAKITWIPRGQGSLNDTLDKLAFRASVSFAGRCVGCVGQASEPPLEGDVFGREVVMLAQEITECQSASLFLTTRFHNVNVMSVRPFPWAMKERAEGIVNVGNMNVAERGEWFGVTADGLQFLHRDLNIYDGLRVEPWNGSRAAVVNAAGDRSEFLRDSIPLRLKSKRPAWIVG